MTDDEILAGLKTARRRFRVRKRKGAPLLLPFDDGVFVAENIDEIIDLCERGKWAMNKPPGTYEQVDDYCEDD